jgi:SWIM zinc finger
MTMFSFTSHPMLTPHDDTVIAWQQACVQAADALRPQHDRERLAKALALAHEGAITMEDDGAALVTSHGTRYRIDDDGLCHCPDAQHRGVPCKHLLAVQIHRQATAFLTAGTPDSTPPAPAHTDRLPSADRWAVTEAPASCCVRLHIGEIELMYTMRDVSDAELTSRVQHLTPWVQDLVDQARERQAQLATLRQQRAAAAAGQTAEPPSPPAVPPASPPPADLQALIQQAVQQALAAQAGASKDQPAAPSQAPDTTTLASPDGWCTRHQVVMERRSNAKGTWWSHWLANEERWCRGK